MIHFCERFLEFMIDLMAQLPTRRFFRAVLMDLQFPVLCHLSPLNSMATSESGDPPGKLFSQLLLMLKYYLHFEIDDQTGAAKTDDELLQDHYEKLTKFQL